MVIAAGSSTNRGSSKESDANEEPVSTSESETIAISRNVSIKDVKM